MDIEIVVALAQNFVIGKDKNIPWHLSEDLKHFKEITSNQTVVMGRRTFESIGKPLPNRENIVVTSDISLAKQGVMVASSLQEAIDKCSRPKLMVIGGQRLYEEALPIAKVLHLTRILCRFDGDTLFPDWSTLPYVMVNQSETFYSEENSFEFVFETWEKNN